MKVSTEIASAASIIGEEKAIEYIAKAGFDAWDFSMFSMCGYDWKNGFAVPTKHPLSSSEYITFARRVKSIGDRLWYKVQSISRAISIKLRRNWTIL